MAIRKFLPLILIFMLAPCAWGQLTSRVQACEQNVSGASSVVCSLAGVGANHLLVGTANLATTGTFVSIADGTLTWTCAATNVAVGATGFKQFFCYAETGAHTGTFNTTLTVSANITNGGFAVVEYAGLALSSPQDGSFVTNSGSSTCVLQTDCTVSVTTTNSEDYIVSLWWHNANSTAGNCCALDSIMWAGGVLGNWVTSAGSQTSAMVDSSSGTWQGLAVAFKFAPMVGNLPVLQIGTFPCLQNGCPAGSPTRTFNVTDHRLLVIIASYCKNPGCTSLGSGAVAPSDSMGNTWTGSPACSLGGCVQIFWAISLTSGADTINMNTSGAISFVSFYFTEWATNPPVPCDIGCGPFVGSGTNTSLTGGNSQVLLQTSAGLGYNSELVIGDWVCFAACINLTGVVAPAVPISPNFPGGPAFYLAIGQFGSNASLTYNRASVDANNFYIGNIAGFAYVPLPFSRRSQVY